MRITFVLVALLVGISSIAQDPTPPSDLEGLALRSWLRSNWYLPWHDDLGYSGAREAMFGSIDAEGGLIECVYTGFTQAAEETTFPDPINTEHTVPQSFFDGNTPMRSDIHHLFPTHGLANGYRGSLPFEEINDNSTELWLFGNSSGLNNTSNIPNSNIDAYSEAILNDAFEPREEHKGNVARAIFYFYTMYTSANGQVSNDITAVGDLTTLYTWHLMDPPDALEIERDEEIQAVQGNYNPYIRMPELVEPAWEIGVGIDDYSLDLILKLDPQSETIQVFNVAQGTQLSLINILGSELRSESESKVISTQGLAAGVYIVQAISPEGKRGAQRIYID